MGVVPFLSFWFEMLRFQYQEEIALFDLQFQECNVIGRPVRAEWWRQTAVGLSRSNPATQHTQNRWLTCCALQLLICTKILVVTIYIQGFLVKVFLKYKELYKYQMLFCQFCTFPKSINSILRMSYLAEISNCGHMGQQQLQ